MVAPDGQIVTWGWEVVTNEGDGPVTLVDVGLEDPSSLAVVEAWVVPVEMTLVGNQTVFPPDPEVSPQWAQRREAPGAVLEPGEAANLVLAVRPQGGADGTAAGTRTRYVDDSGRTFSATAATALEVLQSKPQC